MGIVPWRFESENSIVVATSWTASRLISAVTSATRRWHRLTAKAAGAWQSKKLSSGFWSCSELCDWVWVQWVLLWPKFSLGIKAISGKARDVYFLSNQTRSGQVNVLDRHGTAPLPIPLHFVQLRGLHRALRVLSTPHGVLLMYNHWRYFVIWIGWSIFSEETGRFIG